MGKVNISKKFYPEVATNQVKKLPIAPNQFSSNTTKDNNTDIFNNKKSSLNVSEDVAKKTLSCFDTNKAASMDQIPAKVLKGAVDVLAYSLPKIINLSVKLSVFPEECKIAKLKPLFKKGRKTYPKNYRPISLLPLVS